jgi:hypothetical protein
MEKSGPSNIAGDGTAPDTNCYDVVEHIHRELARLDMPCLCRDQLDRTIVAIEAWRKLKLRRELMHSIARDFAQLKSGIGYMPELARLDQQPLSAQDMQDHADSLKFLADIAERCARRLTELASISSSN